MIPFICGQCKKNFEREIRQTYKGTKRTFCSKQCSDKFFTKTIMAECGNCGTEVIRINAEYKASKSGKVFCNRSCAASYNNTHKTTGTRVSKLEIWLKEQLQNHYTEIEFHFNRKDTINSELDIYIPSLNLAFELNGIFHYEPIYGKDKLQSIQNNDSRKFQACLEHGIELCIIDTSSFKHFKSEKAMKYFEIIKNIIALKMAPSPGTAPGYSRLTVEHVSL